MREGGPRGGGHSVGGQVGGLGGHGTDWALPLGEVGTHQEFEAEE